MCWGWGLGWGAQKRCAFETEQNIGVPINAEPKRVNTAPKRVNIAAKRVNIALKIINPNPDPNPNLSSLSALFALLIVLSAMFTLLGSALMFSQSLVRQCNLIVSLL